MTGNTEAVRNAIKEHRRRKGLSQDELARRIGLRRQAVYDMESGRYLPNTAVALRLARALGCTVEMLFFEDMPGTPSGVGLPGIAVDAEEGVSLCDPSRSFGRGMGQSSAAEAARLALARVRERLVGVPLRAGAVMPFKVDAADAFLLAGRTIDCQISQRQLEKTILVLGCDPALSLLGDLMNRMAPTLRAHTVFASSKQSLLSVNEGSAHVAGIHYHSFGASDGNIEAVRALASGMNYLVIAFSEQEEGIMVARGNPLGLRGVEDMANGKIRFVNREEGAALRKLLDAHLARQGIPVSMVPGYADEVYSHSEGAMRVAGGACDAALGLRIVAESFGLSFVALAVTRDDLVIPQDLLAHPGITALLDVLQSSGLRKELGGLPGYDPSVTGKIIAGNTGVARV